MTVRVESVVTFAIPDAGGDQRDDDAGKAGDLGTNTWIVGDDDEVIVIDAGHDASAILDAVGEREVLAVICTHGLEGHVGAAIEVAERDEAPVAVHPRDRTLWLATHLDEDPDIEIEDGGRFEVADAELEVLHTPGHTPGGVCLYCEDLEAVFAGDTLLDGGPAAVAPPSADFATLLTSIGEKLLTLPPGTRLLSGHGEETTLAGVEPGFDDWVTLGRPEPTARNNG